MRMNATNGTANEAANEAVNGSGTTNTRNIQQSPGRAFLLLTAAMCCFAVLDTTTKSAMARVPPVMALWAVFLLQTVLTTGYLLRRRGPAGFQTRMQTRHLRLHLLRGTLMLGVQGLAFLSLRFLPVGEFTALAMTTPLLVTLLAARVLGEHVSVMRLLLVGGGLLGTLVIVRPGSNALGWAMLLPVALVLVNACLQLLTSRLARTEDAIATLCYSSITATLLISLPLYWFWQTLADPLLWLQLLLMGLAASSGNLLFIMSFERAPAATLMPYMYLQIGLGILGGWLAFGQMPDAQSLLGIALIALCGVAGGLLTLRERRVRSEE